MFRWFVGLNADEPVWDVTVFTKNRERLLAGEVAQAFFAQVLAQARADGLLSDEHFTVDGTLIEAWAGHKSFRRKGDDRQTPRDDPGNPSVDFSVIDGRTTRHPGYAISQTKRKRVEEIFGWLKTIAGCARPIIAELTGWAGCSPLRLLLTTW